MYEARIVDDSQPPSPHDLLTTIQASAYLSVHRSTLIRWEADGLIQSYRLPVGARRYRFGDVEALLSRGPKP